MSDSDSPFDSAILDDLRALGEDVGPDFLKGLFTTFVTNGVAALADMQTAHSAGDFMKVGSIAHRMKSSAGNLGATVVSARCREIENICKDRGCSDALVDDLRHDFERARAEILRLEPSIAQ